MSNSDKRSVSTDALETLGTIIKEGQGRDAIHLAVEPIEAAEKLHPGQDVGIVDGKATAKTEKLLGIVDPFIKGIVQAGDHFWLVVYPRTITSLRHVWSHPEFVETQPALDNKADSEAWLKNFCKSADGPDYETVINTIIHGRIKLEGYEDEGDNYGYGLYDGEKLLFVGNDAHASLPPEFWDHIEIVTGKKISPDNRPEYFSCSC